MSHLKRIQETFKTFTRTNTVWQASNGEVFFNFDDALNYEKATSGSRDVTEWTREKLAKAEAGTEAKTEGTGTDPSLDEPLDPGVDPIGTDPSLDEPLDPGVDPVGTDTSLDEPLEGGEKSSKKVKVKSKK